MAKSRAAYKRKYYKENSEKILTRNLLWKRANSEKHQAHLLNSRFKHRYGITIDQYNEMLEAQGGKCKICGETGPGRKSAARLSVDHCHETGKIRGLLCTRCNSGLGHFNDDPVVIERAIKYLEAHK